MAMALGWSYAAAGHKTVLVDCDFIGRALSLQTNRIGYEGVKEVIKSHKLNGEIAAVDQSNLSVLGIGRDPTMGPESVRKVDFERLFAELRQQFEIVIVDTGPLLASVEALPITVSADGVVLAFRRGRSRKRLEECVRELRSTGACYLGVIMNCADQSDCVRYSSLSRVSQDVIEAEKQGKGWRREGRPSRTDENRLLMALQKPERGS
jgi:Mrp family chromosome partitioning ATPase